MTKKHRRTFALIFEKPNRKDVEWDDFINLLNYLGASIRQQSGSAHGIQLNGEYAVFHKPHPGHTIYPTDLKRIRKFFKNAGVEKVE
jgi:hypothetical protein